MTIASYVQCIARVERCSKSSPERNSPEEVRAHLVQERRVSLSYDEQTRSALRFSYRINLGGNDVPDASLRSTATGWRSGGSTGRGCR